MPGSDGALSSLPYRLRVPTPKARVARQVVPDATVLTDAGGAVLVRVPIWAWSSIRIRGRITGNTGTLGFQFARPKSERNPDQATSIAPFVYTADQPAIDATAWVSGTEFSLEISATEHQGENWLLVTLTKTAGADATVDFLDISGVPIGNSQ